MTFVVLIGSAVEGYLEADSLQKAVAAYCKGREPYTVEYINPIIADVAIKKVVAGAGLVTTHTIISHAPKINSAS